MNFGEVVRKEIVSKSIRETHCKRAFLAGVLRGSGTLYYKDGNIGLDFRLADEESEILIATYLRALYNYEIREMSVSPDRLNNRDKFEISIFGDGATEVLTGLGIIKNTENGLTYNDDFFGGICDKECCFKAFTKGVFLALGSCTVPSGTEKNSGYHLEMAFSHDKPAAQMSERLLDYGVSFKVTRRKESYLLYIKSGEEIKNFLAFINTPVSVLKLTDIMVEKEVLNNVNRQKNCDLGNVNKQVEASQKVIFAIDNIEKKKGLDYLNESLKETAINRREYPEDTLNELAERLGISKSCLNHRLRKIVSVSKEL